MSRRGLTRLATAMVGLLALTGTSSAYFYYYFGGAPARFDLNAVANNTIPFYISNHGPAALTSGDSFEAVVSEIRAAANVWNGVGSSAIRLSYGGLFTQGRIDNSPGIDIEFSDDVPPGLLAVGFPESFGAPATGSNGAFMPITRSFLLLPSDMTQIPYYGAMPSYSEAFFVTLVHEFGHTMGLQHSLASSVMSTLTTSGSSKAQPLGADDIASISLLYPAANYLSTVGSISGRVTMNGTGVGLASVVAISPTNQAICTLTNPDGTYQINGIPPGPTYYVYVHPLPPPASTEATPDNIYFPFDANGNSIPPNYDPATNTFAAQFYSGPNGTRNWQQAQALPVVAANNIAGIDFNVSPRGSEAVYSVRTYGYTQAGLYVSPAPVTLGAPAPVPIAANGGGLLQPDQTVTPGLSVSTLGVVAQLGDLEPYPPPTPYIAIYVLYTTFGVGPGPKHLLFSTPSDLYVLPSAFNAVSNLPPSVTSVTPAFDGGGNRAVVVAGTNLDQNTRILFDGLPGTIETVNADGSLLVTPPPAPGSYTASVVALNADGQSSMYVEQTPPTYTYDPAPAPSLVVSPSVLLPGSTVTVSVVGTNTNFIDPNTNLINGSLVGFGTSDVVVQQVTVLSPTELSVVVTPNIPLSTNTISVTTGLGIISQALGNQVVATDPQPSSN
ncbi:MAG TPA: matrixin family metalloprotease [Bryobacteraceae bacterium]|nr:matrixin family metalloprotease [Bryobacteraceae bacterium]